MKPPKYFTKTFTRFFIGFLCIIGVAFAIMLIVAQTGQSQPSSASVDNFTAPR